MKKIFLSFILSVSLIAGGCSTVKEMETQLPVAVAEKPTMISGTKFVYKVVMTSPKENIQYNETHTFGQQSKGKVVWEFEVASRGMKSYKSLNGDFNPLSTSDSSGNTTFFDPYYADFKWPLKVGKSWSNEYVSTKDYKTGTRVTNSLKVTGFSSVQVLMGTFMAFKIEEKGVGPSSGFHKITYYAPDIGWIIRIEVDKSDGSKAVWELMEHLKDPNAK